MLEQTPWEVSYSYWCDDLGFFCFGLPLGVTSLRKSFCLWKDPVKSLEHVKPSRSGGFSVFSNHFLGGFSFFWAGNLI